VTAVLARAAASVFEQSEAGFFGPATRGAGGRSAVGLRMTYLDVPNTGTVIPKERRASPSDTEKQARD
jgi:hypothetical protein